MQARRRSVDVLALARRRGSLRGQHPARPRGVATSPLAGSHSPCGGLERVGSVPNPERRASTVVERSQV